MVWVVAVRSAYVRLVCNQVHHITIERHVFSLLLKGMYFHPLTITRHIYSNFKW